MRVIAAELTEQDHRLHDNGAANIARLPGLAALQAETFGDPEICIAVIDGPVDISHACFEGADLTVLGGRTQEIVAQNLANIHGTHIASVIFGQQAGPISGIAPRCRGLILPVFSDGPNGTIVPCSETDLARAITTAVERGANVINISGGRLAQSGEANQFLQDAVRQSSERNVLIVAAAGNDGCDCLHVPAALPNVIAVGATDHQEQPMGFSNWGKHYQRQGILAPGEDILGVKPSGGTVQMTGTSFATPLVSGIAGLLLSLQRTRGQTIDTQTVRDAILGTATACDPQKHDDCRRHLVGVINVSAAHEFIERESGSESSGTAVANPAGNAARHITEVGRSASMTDHQSERAVVQASMVASDQTNLLDDGGPVTPAQRADSRQNQDNSEHPNRPDETKEPEVTTGEVSQSGIAQMSPPPVSNQPADEMIDPSGCCAACDAKEPPQLVYVLGQLGYDLGTEARMDAIQLEMGDRSVFDASALVEQLDKHPNQSTAIIWTLNLDLTPIYAIQPTGPFGAETYAFLRTALKDQLPGPGKKEIDIVERVSIPGAIAGQARLLNGMVVPVIVPELRGMFSWSTKALCAELRKMRKESAGGEQPYDPMDGLENFLRRIYEECRNLGTSPQDRAKNYAATNAFSLYDIFTDARTRKLDMEIFTVAKSPICRPDSDCWDIHFRFFHPEHLFHHARHEWILTVDVSDIVPVIVGKPRHWTTV